MSTAERSAQPSIRVDGHEISHGDAIEHAEYGTLECTRVTASMGSVSADFAIVESPGALALTYTQREIRAAWGDELRPGGDN